MNGALIVGAAPAPDPDGHYRRLLAEPYSHVIAADAAGEWCVAMGRVPDVTVGDFDSAREGARHRLEVLGSRTVLVPVDKDQSDLDLCVLEARAAGVDEVTFTACSVLRIDHTLAALGSMLRSADLDACVLEPTWSGWTVGGPQGGTRRLIIGRGRVFSVLAPAGAEGVTVRGGVFPLENGRLEPLSSLGLSNVAAREDVAVTVEAGIVLVIVPAPECPGPH